MSKPQVRQSQLITTFGPGAMVDLPDYSVLIAGLEFWHKRGAEILEPRLTQRLAQQLKVDALRLFKPPPADDSVLAADDAGGVTVWQFPEWFITPELSRLDAPRDVRARRLVHRRALTRGNYVDENRERHPVVPVRFVRACRRGHIGDIDWYAFAHEGRTECRRNLWIDERGTSGDLNELTVRCECGRSRVMNQATVSTTKPLGLCDGGRPWLGGDSREGCDQPNRLLIRTASNAYFGQQMRVITLPDRGDRLAKAVDLVYEQDLQYVESVNDLRRELKKQRIRDAVGEFAEAELWSHLEARRRGTPAPDQPVKVAELQTLMAATEELPAGAAHTEFLAQALPEDQWRADWTGPIERVVLVHRLREVAALAGFTRFEAAGIDPDGELAVDVRTAALSREVEWLPAVETRGEGVFLQFSADAIKQWLARPGVQARGRELEAAHAAALAEAGQSRRFPGLPYAMLHTFSHLLLTAISLECGYPSSSIRERVYAFGDVGYGVLLYTASADAEGTLGGLVHVGRAVARHVKSALRRAELCSNDPVCAQHAPDDLNEGRPFHGAACHGCLLLSETSCELQNDYLDRALIVPTVTYSSAAIFERML